MLHGEYMKDFISSQNRINPQKKENIRLIKPTIKRVIQNWPTMNSNFMTPCEQKVVNFCLGGYKMNIMTRDKKRTYRGRGVEEVSREGF